MVNVGDLDGDALEDVAVGLDAYDYEGSVWVTLSERGLPSARVAGVAGWRGFAMRRSRVGQLQLTGLGDVDGDGLREVAVRDGQHLYVVFGRTDGTTVDLADLGDDGFVIEDVWLAPDSGGGHRCCGIVMGAGGLVSAGDQNGDGRDDVAFSHAGNVSVAYSPADAAGATLDPSALGEGGFTLASDADQAWAGNLGDIDADGRDDLLIGWRDESAGIARVAGIVSPGAGDRIDALEAAEAGAGFELTAPTNLIQSVVVLTDQNGDGRRDVSLRTGGRTLVGFSAPLGTRRSIAEPVPGESEEWNHFGRYPFEVGDQDGDGRGDFGITDELWLSGSGENIRATHLPRRPWIAPVTQGMTTPPSYGGFVVGSVDDRNGDGTRELLTAIADPFYDNPEFSEEGIATWHADVFLSAPRPAAENIAEPALVDGQLEFSGTFVTAPEAGTPSLAALPAVELEGSEGTTVVEAPELVPAGERRTTATVAVDPGLARLQPGSRYEYRMLMANTRGLTGASERRSFTYRPAGASTGPRISLVSLSRRRLVVGRHRATLRWQLDRPARVAIGVERVRYGWRSRGRCTARRRSTRRARRCVIANARGFATRRGRIGMNQFRFSGRIGDARLRPGRYRLVLAAIDAAGGASRARRLSFRVVRARKR